MTDPPNPDINRISADVVIDAVSQLSGPIALDRSSPVPLYHQLFATIRQLVADGRLLAGEQLPPERELAEMAAVSRMTARQALADLERDGVVTVRHGVGTFIAAPRFVYDAIHLQGFTEMAEQSGLIATSRVVGQHVSPASPSETDALGLPNRMNLLRIVRVRSLGGSAIVLETSQLDAVRFGGLTGEDLGQSLYRLLERRFGVRLTHAEETIEARLADEREAELLGIAAGSPTLVVSGTAYQGGTAVEWFRSVYPAERVRLAVTSQRQVPGVDAGTQSVSMVLA